MCKDLIRLNEHQIKRIRKSDLKQTIHGIEVLNLSYRIELFSHQN